MIVDFKLLQNTTSEQNTICIANDALACKLPSQPVKSEVETDNDTFKSDIYECDTEDESSTQDNAPMRCYERDIFHQFQDLPLLKPCLVKSITCRLMTQATYLFAKEDFDKVSTYLLSVAKLRTLLLDHYYHNREWW